MWQVSWAWGFGVYLIWKTWGIDDTHLWRIQTIVAVTAGLVNPSIK